MKRFYYAQLALEGGNVTHLNVDFVFIKMFTKVGAIADIHAPILGPVFS